MNVKAHHSKDKDMALTKINADSNAIFNKEYFRVDLTTSQLNIADTADATVDFNGNGTVIYDTKSKWDSGNNAYLLGSTGLYLICYSCAICSDAINTEIIQDAGSQIEVATDGSTYAGMFGASYRPNDNGGGGSGDGIGLSLIHI